MTESESKSARSGAQQTLQEVYSLLHAMGSVPPAIRFRAEGYLQVILELKLLSREDVLELIEAAYRDAFDTALFVGVDQRVQCISPDSQQVRLPVTMVRAPVYPSTSE